MGKPDEENFTTYVEEVGQSTYIGKAARSRQQSIFPWLGGVFQYLWKGLLLLRYPEIK